ncbi:CdaR family transcriptional regulator [Bacillus sp. EB600]|uniref:PucR family transcriptional regulator n=1 Tax=Bacillus sp. EB600 TaxID=2806345 RepID=UPI00210E331B|nr:helix-turn-helix domain-containing protein [Bacillus sp. EB600]MCQ6282024.1 helix-turn-helix domain-containing protein [Bacillus sp. EB600]
MKTSFQDLLLSIPMYQLTFLTPLPKERVYYETIVSGISDQWFQDPTLLVIQNNEDCMKLDEKDRINQLIQDLNLIAIVICLRNHAPIQEDSLALYQQCQVPIIQVDDSSALSVFQERNDPFFFYSQISMELNGFMKKGFMNIAANLSKALGTPFLYFDENDQLLWQTEPEIDKQQLVAAKPFEKYPINIAGHIHLTLAASAHLVDWQKNLVDKLIGLTALLFQTEEMFREQQEKFKEHFVYDLLYHKFESKKVMITQGKAWGWNLENAHHLFIINVDQLGEMSMNLEWMDEMITHIEALIAPLQETIIIFPFQDQIVVMVEDGENCTFNERKKFVTKIANQIEQELKHNWPHCKFSIGIGKWYQDTINLNKSYQEAKMALQFGQVWFENKQVFHMNDLGILHLLTSIHREILYDFSQEYLASLIDSDLEQGTEYVKTLKAYIQHQGIISEVSEALYVHPNTLRNRIKKIEEITGISLQNSVEFTDLVVAVKIYFSMFL